MRNVLLRSFLAVMWCPWALTFVTHNVMAPPRQHSTELHWELPRRDFQHGLLSGIVGAGALSSGQKRAEAASGITSTKPLADVKMVRLKLPQGGFGREYVALKLKVKGSGPYDFMVDSGLTLEMITPHLQKMLGIHEGKNRLSGLAAGGSTVSNALVPLTGAAIAGENEDLALPQLIAAVTSFPQEHIDPNHDPVEGMLGMEVSRLRFYKPGTADTTGLVEIPAVVINESLLIGIRISTPEGNTQPIIGFLDCGSTFSCINWKAAEALGLPPKTDPSYRNSPAVQALGIDGRPLLLPTVKKQISFVGDPIVDPKSGKPTGFEKPPSNWKAWDPVQVAVGDIPVFSQILGDGVTPYQGPAALIGLDILSQRRLILEAGTDNSRARKVAVSPN
ncbi:aspartyl protease [Nitzschia inconspicua]|uniref:Aspartyl protease n=1 Tax=Nitzschia inconspicua TaxID=303405 RepID=A0A9K3L3L0_9STRA|nr:aspartyl protease [Nitzschia inconspicua]